MELKIGVGTVISQDGCPDRVVLCVLDGTKAVAVQGGVEKLVLDVVSMEKLGMAVLDGTCSLSEPERRCVDETAMTEVQRDLYAKKVKAMRDVVSEYGPDFLGLVGNGRKPGLIRIRERYGFDRANFWRLLVRFLQSGLDETSMLDGRKTRGPTDRKIGRKQGRPKENPKAPGKMLTATDFEAMDRVIALMKKRKIRKLKEGYLKLLTDPIYRRTSFNDGVYRNDPAPPDELPSARQWEYYFKKKVSTKELDKIRHGAVEANNLHKLIIGDSTHEAEYPGHVVQVDANEFPCSLVSTADRGQVVGGVVVYMAVDVYSRAIVAVSVGFENNSNLGLSNLFLNMADDKVELCRKAGLEIAADQWPSGFIPAEVRTDNGSDMISSWFDSFCEEQNVICAAARAGGGSEKGIVEQEWHQLLNAVMAVLYGKGLISTRRGEDGKWHDHATYTVLDFTRLVYAYVIRRNCLAVTGYPLTDGMVEAGVRPVPKEIWAYGGPNAGLRTDIVNRDQFYWSLLMPAEVRAVDGGLEWKGLIYDDAASPELSARRYDMRRKIRKVDGFRHDPRDCGRLWYLDGAGLLKFLPLNPRVAGNVEKGVLTEYELDKLNEKRKALVDSAEAERPLIEAGSLIAMERIGSEAAPSVKGHKPKTAEIRENRRIEQSEHNRRNSLASRMAEPEPAAAEVADGQTVAAEIPDPPMPAEIGERPAAPPSFAEIMRRNREAKRKEMEEE